jgi:hypothetical protein
VGLGALLAGELLSGGLEAAEIDTLRNDDWLRWSWWSVDRLRRPAPADVQTLFRMDVW